MDTKKMFDEPFFFKYCCITAKLGETENSLQTYFGFI